MVKKISRRDFIKTTVTASGAAALMPQITFSSQNMQSQRLPRSKI